METQVLIVDDEAPLRYVINEMLLDFGCEALQAENGIIGLTILAQHPHISVILCDVRMPEMDGLEFLRQVMVQYPYVSVIMLTSHGTIHDAVQAMREGAINYLMKPINQRQLLDVVTEGLQRSQERAFRQQLQLNIVSGLEQLGINTFRAAVPIPDPLLESPSKPNVKTRFYQIGDLLIDEDRVLAMYQGEPLELTPTEFELLYCLVKANGRVVSFEDLACGIKGVKMMREEARVMLSSHFANLRSKLRQAGCQNYLRNRRGVGYFLSPT